MEQIIEKLEQQRAAEEKLAVAAGKRGDTQSYVAHSHGERAFRQAIEIVQQGDADADRGNERRQIGGWTRAAARRCWQCLSEAQERDA